ncbi:unnamed protein product, partial [Musa acuminata subsp. burmannicoides]
DRIKEKLFCRGATIKTIGAFFLGDHKNPLMSVQKKAIMSQDRTGDDHQKARCFYCMEFWLMTMMVQF